MKTYFINQLIAFSYLLRYVNSKIWDLGLSKHHDLFILKGNRKKFVHFGEIAKNIYSTQHLTRFNKGFEYKTLLKFESYLFEGAVVLDIGANIGLFSLLASERIGKNGRIYAFEPSLKTSKALIENLKLNNCENVKVIQSALSDTDGSVELTRPQNSDDAFNYMKLDNSISSNNANEVSKMQRLDNFLKEENIKKVDLIKIDVEGAEYLVLKGAYSIFSNGNKPVIIFECYEPWCKRFNVSVFETLNVLAQFGYKFEQYDEQQWVALPS